MISVDGSYREFKLDNGLLVALQNTQTKTVLGELKVWHGALNEKKGEEGLAHFLEHVFANGGTKKYDPEKAYAIKGSFGSFNAATGLRRSYCSVNMLSEDTSLFLEYASDMMFNPRFDPARVEEERKRVFREIAEKKGRPDFKDYRGFKEAFFGKGSIFTYQVLGEEEVIQSASIEQLRALHKRGFHPNNADLILVGALPENIEELVRTNFENLKPGTYTKLEIPRNAPLIGKAIIHTYAPDLLNSENPHESNADLSIRLFAPTNTDEDSCATSILTDILGGNSSSRIFTKVSRRKGLAYSVGAQYDGTDNLGIIEIGGSIHSSRSEEAINAIFDEMAKLRTELVSTDELDGVKKKSRFELAKLFERNKGYLDMINLRLDSGLVVEDYADKIAKVTPEEIREAAIKYLPESRASDNYVLMLRDPLKK